MVGRLIFHSTPLEERNSVQLVLGFCHDRDCSPYLHFALNFTLRVHTDGGSALYRNNILDYLQINQL